MEENQMPLHPSSRRLKDCPESVPMSLLNESFAKQVHDQTLKRLKERGGLSASEIIGNMKGINVYKSGCALDEASCIKMLNEILKTL